MTELEAAVSQSKLVLHSRLLQTLNFGVLLQTAANSYKKSFFLPHGFNLFILMNQTSQRKYQIPSSLEATCNVKNIFNSKWTHVVNPDVYSVMTMVSHGLYCYYSYKCQKGKNTNLNWIKMLVKACRMMGTSACVSFLCFDFSGKKTWTLNSTWNPGTSSQTRALQWKTGKSLSVQSNDRKLCSIETILSIFFPNAKNVVNRIEELSAIDLGFLIVFTKQCWILTIKVPYRAIGLKEAPPRGDSAHLIQTSCLFPLSQW